MTSESPPIRVRSLVSVLDGNDPVEFIHRLLRAGYDRFYVKVPKGFRISLIPTDPFPPGYQLWGNRQSTQGHARPHGNQDQIRYMQLDTPQLRELLEYPPVVLRQFNAGGLESASTHDGIPSINFKYRKGFLGGLLPTEGAIADKVPTEFDVASGAPTVVKVLNRIRSQYSYILHGVSFKDVFVDALALGDALKSRLPAKDVSLAGCEHVPDDPYGLKDSSPLVYEILRRASRNRDKTRSEIDVPLLAAEFRELNAGYKKNPKPFNDGRHEFAAMLANPNYRYSSAGLGEIDSPEETVEIPADKFLDQGFINPTLRKLLYAACRWSGRKEPALGDDREKLVDLLVGLGFFDREDSDQVQSLVYFITGEKYKRNKHKSEFRHIRSDR
ncbi:hypothetical protein BJD12_18650 [Xanthomonas vesicatoria ATCC 35937]|nr:hypothetical protein BJD12_18650 [Xanthomonas vesicatoria ATCC 35937]